MSDANAGGQGPDAPPKPDAGESRLRKKRRRRGTLGAFLGLLAGIGGLAGSRLGNLWIAFDVFSQFTVQFAFVTIAFLIGLFMPRAKLLFAFVVLIVCLVGYGMWPHYLSGSPREVGRLEAGQRALKVAHFNTWYDNRQIDAVRGEIERIGADVITLVEVGPAKKPLLDALRSLYPHQANCFDKDFCNQAILSKLPIADSSSEVAWAGPPYIRAKLGPEAGNVTIIGVHTIRFPHSRAQFRQVAALADLAAAEKGNLVVMGDFNATPFSRILRTLTDRGRLTRLTDLPTWPARLELPQVAIDHIFVSAGIKPILSQQIGEAAGSDHYPVYMTVAVPLGP